ncbi:MAG: trypsin-like peptidase domain-containing protein [Patescibacteria group bacterium]
MPLYQLPEFKFSQLKKPDFPRGKGFLVVLLVLFSFLAGGMGGLVVDKYLLSGVEKINLELSDNGNEYIPVDSQEEQVINVVKESSPSVVSIIISKDIPIIEEYYAYPFGPSFPEFRILQYRQNGTEKQEVGGGTGFIISSDGLILTNKHVVSDIEAEYTVLMNDGKRYPAKVLALDPTQDLALISIDTAQAILPAVKLGDSDNLQIGQTVITIGNALGEFRNTVSVGVVSGLSRTITASGGGISETIEDVIQTDAAINSGNSGGPLLNLKGEVIGINTATVTGAQNIGFAIPINKAKRDIEQVKAIGKISYPFLGVRYISINDAVREENNLPVDYGVWIKSGDNGEPAITPGSPAERAGLKEGDIILEFSGEKIIFENNLGMIIEKYNPGDKVTLKVLSGSNEKVLEVTLSERKP